MELFTDFIVVFCILGMAGCVCYIVCQYKIIRHRKEELTQGTPPRPNAARKEARAERQAQSVRTEEWTFSFDDEPKDAAVLEVEL